MVSRKGNNTVRLAPGKWQPSLPLQISWSSRAHPATWRTRCATQPAGTPMPVPCRGSPPFPLLCTSFPFPQNRSAALLDEGLCTWQTGATSVLAFLGSVNNSAAQRICLAIPSAAQLSILYSRSMNEPKPFICILFKLPSTTSMRPLEVCCKSSRAKIFSQA